MDEPFRFASLVDSGEDFGVFTLEGKDTEDFLHRQLSNVVRELSVGAGVPNCLLNKEGRILLYFTLWKQEGNGFRAIVPGEQRRDFYPLLDRVLFREEVRIKDQTEDIKAGILAGNNVEEVLTKTTLRDCHADLYRSLQLKIEGLDVGLYRVDWLKCPCFLVLTRSASYEVLKGRLMEAGTVGETIQAFHMGRIEKGAPWPGYEVDSTMIPFECGLSHTASLTKGCYVGQEIIARIHNLGKPPRVLRGLVIEGDSIPGKGTPVLHEKVEVGKVLSSAWSVRLARPIAASSVRTKYTADRTRVTVGGVNAEVRDFPLV